MVSNTFHTETLSRPSAKAPSRPPGTVPGRLCCGPAAGHPGRGRALHAGPCRLRRVTPRLPGLRALTRCSRSQGGRGEHLGALPRARVTGLHHDALVHPPPTSAPDTTRHPSRSRCRPRLRFHTGFRERLARHMIQRKQMVRLMWHVRDRGSFPQPGCSALGTATWNVVPTGIRSEPSPWAVSLPVRAARTENPERWGSGR